MINSRAISGKLSKLFNTLGFEIIKKKYGISEPPIFRVFLRRSDPLEEDQFDYMVEVSSYNRIPKGIKQDIENDLKNLILYVDDSFNMLGNRVEVQLQDYK